MQAKTDHKRGFVWGLALAVTMTISSIWGQAVSSGQFVRAAQVEVTPVPAAQQTNTPQIDSIQRRQPSQTHMARLSWNVIARCYPKGF